MSTIKLFQRLRELSYALDSCEDEDERSRIEDEIYEIECELADEDKDHYSGKQEYR